MSDHLVSIYRENCSRVSVKPFAPLEARLSRSAREFDLSATYVGRKQAVLALELLALMPELRRVALPRSCLGDGEAPLVEASLSKLCFLTVIDLANNEFTRDSIPTFLRLAEALPTLKSFSLVGNPISEDDTALIALQLLHATQRREHYGANSSPSNSDRTVVSVFTTKTCAPPAAAASSDGLQIHSSPTVAYNGDEEAVNTRSRGNNQPSVLIPFLVDDPAGVMATKQPSDSHVADTGRQAKSQLVYRSVATVGLLSSCWDGVPNPADRETLRQVAAHSDRPPGSVVVREPFFRLMDKNDPASSLPMDTRRSRVHAAEGGGVDARPQPPAAINRRTSNKKTSVGVIDTVPLYQDATAILARLLAPGIGDRTSTRFSDTEFPPCAQSLFSLDPLDVALTKAAPYEWRRLSSIQEAGGLPLVVFGLPPSKVRTSNPFDLASSGTPFARKYLTNALNVMATVPDLLRAVLVKSYVDLGMYVVRFQLPSGGAGPIDIAVDDFVPVVAARHNKGEGPIQVTLAGVSCEDPQQVWAPIIEKALAKLVGGYDRLSGGSLGGILRDLIGCVFENRVWSTAAADTDSRTGSGSRHDSITVYRDLLRSGQFAPLLRRLISSYKWVLAEPHARTAASAEALRSNGLAANECYIVDAIREIIDRQPDVVVGSPTTSPAAPSVHYTLVRLRQPDRTLRWSGRFGRAHPDAKRFEHELHYQGDPDGNFLWMTLQDFAAFFEGVWLIHFVALPPLASPPCVCILQSHGHFVDETRGAPFGEEDWCDSPWLHIRASAAQATSGSGAGRHCWVTLAQPDRRLNPLLDGAGQHLLFPAHLQIVAFAVPTTGNEPEEMQAGTAAATTSTASSSTATTMRSFLLGDKPRNLTRRQIIAETPLVAAREVMLQIEVPKHHSVLVVLCCGDPVVKTVQYRTTVLASQPGLSCVALESTSTKQVVTGLWEGIAAAGRLEVGLGSRGPIAARENPRSGKHEEMSDDAPKPRHGVGRGFDNPQFRLTLYTASNQQPQVVSIVLTQRQQSNNNLVPISFAVFAAHSRIRENPGEETPALVHVTDYARERSVSTTLTLGNAEAAVHGEGQATSFVIVASTWQPGCESSFSLAVYTSGRADLRKLPSM